MYSEPPSTAREQHTNRSSGKEGKRTQQNAVSQTPRTKTPARISSARSSCSSLGGASSWCTVGPGKTGRGPQVSTAAGMAGRMAKTNQDASFVYRRKTGGDDFICGVIDGHGQQGHQVSDFVRNTLASQIMQERKQAADLGTRAAISRGFVNTANRLRDRRDIDARQSGAVVAVCMRRGQDVYVANVGDTRAVLVEADDGGRVKGRALTQDHTPELPAEKSRIHARGGEVGPGFFPGVGFAGPPRVWQRGQGSGGLCVTRAIGDTSLNNVGVIADPDVVKHRLKPTDRYVVIASDGCWDHVTNDRAAKLTMQHKDPRVASEAIVHEAREAWKQTAEGSGYIDDITCLVVPVST